MRLFAAVYPTRAAREHLVSALREVRELTGTALRWGDPEQWHVTLGFYGDQPEGAVPDLAEHLSGVARETAPFTSCLRGAGSFSGTTLWMGLGGQAENMVELMRACSLNEDERARQRAHLTVARMSRAERTRKAREQRRRSRTIARPSPELSEVVHALSVYEGPEWTVSEIRLMASVLGEGRGGGALHQEVERFPLRGR
ncbi:RNA 2',3'-cyclic phosphodiesterase [Kocuria gwangalliensis]|uniref:RNA 2',3'-cyclic phosphodiesterase n=1 Tax=Kocuria gwangalliensis TaxID=501592 RepID=A0ABP8WRA1_9MICC